MSDISSSELILRPEVSSDHRAVEELTRDTFWNLYVPGCDEHHLVHVMREHRDFVADLSFVVEFNGRLVGNIMTTRSWLRAEGRELDTLSVGPVTVHPSFQRRGIGRTMITRVENLGRERGFGALTLFGSPYNYVCYGYRNGKDLGISMPDGSHPFGLMAKELQPGALSGQQWSVHQSDVFAPSPNLEEFDATFPPRKKAWQPSQELYSMSVRAQLI